jgi:hypothetical protein
MVGGVNSMLYHEALLLECLGSLLYFEVEIALYDDDTHHSHEALPCCTHVEAFLMD